jgi:hypothetical protein
MNSAFCPHGAINMCLDVRTNSDYFPVQAKREGRDYIVGRLRAGGFEVRTPMGGEIFRTRPGRH